MFVTCNVSDYYIAQSSSYEANLLTEFVETR